MHIHIASMGGNMKNVVTRFNAVSSIDILHLIVNGQRRHSTEDLGKKMEG